MKEMTLDEAKSFLGRSESINEYLEQTGFEPINLSKGGACPVCGGGHNTPCAHIKDGRMKCFSCDRSGDLQDWIGFLEGVSDSKERFKRATSFFGISITGETSRKKATPEEDFSETATNAVKALSDFNEYYRTTQADPTHAKAYLRGRGISNEVINKYNVGYDQEKQAVIVPVSETYYYARSISGSARRFYNPKGATVAISNEHLLRQDKPVFIVEGVIDAMSIETAGGQAIALHSTSNSKKLAEAIKKIGKAPTLILAFDNDEAGQHAADEAKKALDQLEVTFIKANLCGRYSDPNDLLLNEPDILAAEVETAIEQAFIAEQNAEVEKELRRKERLREYKAQNSTAAYIEDFFKTVNEKAGQAAISTGFEDLDKALDGGLFEGLYIMGAISSLGKTTLALQIADNIARSGIDVLIFSLEMARFELAAKSISRQTFYLDNTPGKQLAKTTRGIMTGAKYKYYSQDEKDLISAAAEAYRGIAENMYIIEGSGDIGVITVRKFVENHIALTGKRPVVFIDYLQILDPIDTRASDKTNTDMAVKELKRISRDYKLPVFAISSLNRDNYSAAMNMAAFKESGAIEYSSDVLIGLQIEGADEFKTGDGNKGKNLKETEAKKKKDPREIELKILKNRNGKICDNIGFYFYPGFNTFEETIFL